LNTISPANGLKILIFALRRRSVNVSAPNRVSLGTVDDFVLSNAEKILAAQKRFADKNLAECKYLTGDKVNLLGKEYPLIVSESSKNGYSFEDGKIYLFVKDSEVFENRLAAFFSLCRDISARVFPEIINDCYPLFSDVCREVPQLKLRNMKSQWGNCRPKQNVITLSIRLAQYNKEIIRFVILHEFCHFYEANHSEEFYSHLSKVLPNRKEYDRILKGK
jgi:predicted metal-dependent hydrolase